MLKSTLESLRDYIKLKNPYFDEALELAYNKPEAEMFIDDNRGDYFYLRLPNNIQFVQGGEYVMTECSAGIAARATVVLVAFKADGDEDILLANLVNTLQASGKTIQFVSAIYRRETVVQEELRGQTKEVIDSALQRIPDRMAIVSVTFTVAAAVALNLCILNPCKSC